MLRGALLDPRGLLVGGLVAAAAWVLGVMPAAAIMLGLIVVGVEVAVTGALQRPGRRAALSPRPEPAPGRDVLPAGTPAPAAPRPESGGPPAVAGGAEGGVFRQEGDIWRVGMGCDVYLLRDAKGLRYLRVLLGNPGREFHVLQLVEAVDGSTPAWTRPVRVPEGAGAGGDGGEPRLDARAKAAYRERLQALRLEAEEARRWHDDERAVRAEMEIEALAGELARAVGLGGRDRRAGVQAERARVNVTRAIRSAIDRIAELDRSLGHHLSSTVHTGTFCSYSPDPLRPPAWEV